MVTVTEEDSVADGVAVKVVVGVAVKVAVVEIETVLVTLGELVKVLDKL